MGDYSVFLTICNWMAGILISVVFLAIGATVLQLRHAIRKEKERQPSSESKEK